LIQIGKYIPPEKSRCISTGFSTLDQKIGGLSLSSVSLLTGKSGEGKSTVSGQLALNAINAGGRVCFYSGELSAAMFQSWIIKQAAGGKYLEHYIDSFGADRYHCDPFIESRIKSWLIDKFILYDNSVTKSSEMDSILKRFMVARQYYGCNVFFIDNLMTARYTTDMERDFNRQQSNFVGKIVDFAQQQQSHVILIAHPRKTDSGDINDDVAGSK
jgi:twinkle protein